MHAFRLVGYHATSMTLDVLKLL